jgi:hypothetical protein
VIQNVFSPHSDKQESLLFSEKSLSIGATGIQWGKTMIGVVWMKKFMHMFTDPSDNFIVTSPTYKILYQSTMPPFLQLNEHIGRYNKKDEFFQIYGGGKVWFRTGTDPDSVVGITNVRAILCDEAGKYTRYFWDNIQARSSFCEAPVMIVTSPYSLNWLYTDFIRPWHKKNEYIRKEILLVQARSNENPYFPREEYEKKKRTMDPRRHNMIYGGAFEKAEGLVYDVFNDDLHICDPFALPAGTRFFGGVDWGYTDPFVISVRAVTPDGYHFKVGEYYKTRCTKNDMTDAAASFSAMWPIERFYCDPSRPEYIAEFCSKGLKAVAANNEIRKGIDRHYELIKEGRYQVFRDSSPHTIDETSQYHYPEPKDLKPDQNQKDELPVDQHNHCMDTERYITSGTFNIGKKKNSVIIENESKTRIAYQPVDTEMASLLKKKKVWQNRGNFE